MKSKEKHRKLVKPQGLHWGLKNNPGYVRLAKHKHYKTSHLITRSVKNVSRWKCGILGRVPRYCLRGLVFCVCLFATQAYFPLSCLAYLSSLSVFVLLWFFGPQSFVCEGLSGAQRILYCFPLRSCRPTGCPPQVWECVCTYTCVWFLAFVLKSPRLRRLSPRQQAAPLCRGDHQGVLC